MHGREGNPFNPTDPIQPVLYAHSDHGSRCFTISRVLKGLKAVSAHAIRSSKAAPGSLGKCFSKLQILWGEGNHGEKYPGNIAAIGHFASPQEKKTAMFSHLMDKIWLTCWD